MSYGAYSLLITLALFFAMLGTLVFGRHYARKRRAHEETEAGIGPVNAAIFGLLGLMVAFTGSVRGIRPDRPSPLHLVPDGHNYTVCKGKHLAARLAGDRPGNTQRSRLVYSDNAPRRASRSVRVRLTR
jgi:hypothetical protein